MEAATLTDQLEKAIEEGNQKRFDALLAQGADPNATDLTKTPLIGDAAYYARDRMFEALLAKGADFRAVDGDDWGELGFRLSPR
jgi:ankyrin repeat protein